MDIRRTDLLVRADRATDDSRSMAARSRRVLESFDSRLAVWHTDLRPAARNADTQDWLAAVVGVLKSASAAIGAQLPGSGAGLGGPIDPALLSSCRRADRRVLWLDRLFTHYRAAFEQRAGDDQTIAAADQVVRSCWAAAHWPDHQVPPLPMPYLDIVHAPEAFPSSMVPADLRVAVDPEFLREVLAELPVPLVRLPQQAASDPWLFGLLAHECGHHLQYAADLRGSFRAAIADAAGASGGQPQGWEAWAEEVFADLVSVHLLGAAAIWPIILLEFDETAAMQRSKGTYPPPTVRLGLLLAMADALGMTDHLPIGRADLPDHPEMKVVDSVAGLAEHAGPGGQSLGEWLSFDAQVFGPNGRSAKWAAHFDGTGLKPAPSRDPEEPRILIAGLLRQQAGRGLAEVAQPAVHPSTFIDLLVASTPPVRRGGALPAASLSRAGRSLGEALLRLDQPEVSVEERG